MFRRPVIVISCTASLAGLAATADPAHAIVEMRSATCGQTSTTSLTLARPSGVVSGDVLVAHVGFADSGAPTAPAGWTQVPNLSGQVNGDQRLVTWYRIASGSEPANYTFSGTGTTDGTSGGMAAYSGVDVDAPIAGTPAQSINSSVANDNTLPNSSGVRAGSMRISAAANDDMGSATYQAPMVRICDEVNGAGSDISTSFAREPTGAGTTATRTVNHDDNGRAIMHTLVLSSIPCSMGGLNLTAPTGVSFGSVALTGANLTRTTTAAFTVDDQRGTGAGWNLTATSTTFTSGGNTLPTTATTITGVSTSAGTDRCAAPTSSIGYPITLPAATTAPAAVKIFNAATTTGRGPTNLTFDLGLAIPASTRIGTYNSTWTFTLATGP